MMGYFRFQKTNKCGSLTFLVLIKCRMHFFKTVSSTVLRFCMKNMTTWEKIKRWNEALKVFKLNWKQNVFLASMKSSVFLFAMTENYGRADSNVNVPQKNVPIGSTTSLTNSRAYLTLRWKETTWDEALYISNVKHTLSWFGWRQAIHSKTAKLIPCLFECVIRSAENWVTCPSR